MSSFNEKNRLTFPLGGRFQDFFSAPLGGNADRKNSFLTLGVGILLTAFVFILVGCSTTSSSKKGNSIFDPSGSCLFNSNCALSGKKKEGDATKLDASKESKIVKNAEGTACGDSPWNEKPAALSQKPSGQESVTWSTQRPNGAVLFPKTLDRYGPMVVMEPRSIIAQVGTEVVMVASYVGPKNSYLRTSQKLEWNLDGDGFFLASNPTNGCLYCDESTKKVNDQYMITSTSAKLWRIHRGTSTPEDDITILRGQSWATVQANREGTSAISVFAPNIDDWTNRTASGQIHWIDASFHYPTSRVAPQGETVDMTTTIFRKTTNEPRPGWLVRYEVLSGPAAGFGAGLDKTVEIATNDIGKATIPFTQASPVPGSNKIKVQIIRPASDDLERVIVDEQTITQVWSGNPLFNLAFQGPESVSPNSQAHYQMNVSNLSPIAQDAVVRMTLPAGTSIATSNPPVSEANGDQITWILNQIPGNSQQPILFDLNTGSGGALNFNAQVSLKSEYYSETPANTPSSTAPPMEDIPPATLPTSPAPQTSVPQTPTASDTPVLTPPMDTPKTETPPKPETAPAEGIVIHADLFPTEATNNTEFHGVVKLTKTGIVPDVSLSIIFNDGLYFVLKNIQTGETINRYEGKAANPVTFDQINFDQEYLVHFMGDRLGPKTITFRAHDKSTNKVIASQDVKVTIVP